MTEHRAPHLDENGRCRCICRDCIECDPNGPDICMCQECNCPANAGNHGRRRIMTDKRDECGCHRTCMVLEHDCVKPCVWPKCLTPEEHQVLKDSITEEDW